MLFCFCTSTLESFTLLAHSLHLPLRFHTPGSDIYLIQNFRKSPCALWTLQSLTRSAGSAQPRKHRTCRRLLLADRSAPLERSKRPLEAARLHQGARDGRSSQLGSARALEMAARASSAPLGRSKWPLEPARLRWGDRKMPLELARLCQAARNCSAWLLENTAPADVSEVEPARLGWDARHWRSSPLGSPGPETLHWAGPRMLVALNTETNMLFKHILSHMCFGGSNFPSSWRT